MNKEIKNLDEKEVELASGGKSVSQKLLNLNGISLPCTRINEHTSKCSLCGKEYKVSYGNAEMPHNIRKEIYCPNCRYKN